MHITNITMYITVNSVTDQNYAFPVDFNIYYFLKDYNLKLEKQK